MFSVVHNLELLQKSRAAVQAGAQILLVDLWTDPTHSSPAAAALMSGAFLLTSGEGQTYSEQDARINGSTGPDGGNVSERRWQALPA
jgi:hypothetical protein